MAKPMLALDFDGVLHSYTSGWKGAHVIPDEPVPGAMDFIVKASQHYIIAISSARSSDKLGMMEMKNWLLKHLGTDPERVAIYNKIKWPIHKPPAFLTIDDRVICFRGEWPSIHEIESFKSWVKP